MSLPEQNTTRERWVDENMMECEAGNDKKYKMESIWDSAVYKKELVAGHLPSLHYLISWKGYPKEENTWEPALVVQNLQKLLGAFYKDNLDKLIAISVSSNIAPPIA